MQFFGKNTDACHDAHSGHLEPFRRFRAFANIQAKIKIFGTILQF